MTVAWKLTVDCASPTRLAEFWAAALGYVPAQPPAGFATWQVWLRAHDVPQDDWGSVAFLSDPEGILPSLSFLQVPEAKAGKNRLHLDLQVGGGRHLPWEERWPRVLADPEGNELCVV